jgi:hypothetical protein
MLSGSADKQAYPALGIRFLVAIGKMTPPRDEPVEITPSAKPLFNLNQ